MGARGQMQDHYEVLGVNHDAPDEVIRAAYKALAAKYHPDRNPGEGRAELQVKRINAAFAVLGDAQKRKQYDELTRGVEASDEPPAQTDENQRPSSSTTEGPSVDEKATQSGNSGKGAKVARWGFAAVILACLGGVLDGGGGAVVFGLIPALVCISFFFAKGQKTQLDRAEKVVVKWLGYLFLAFALVGGGVFLYWLNANAEQAAVTVEATYDPTACREIVLPNVYDRQTGQFVQTTPEEAQAGLLSGKLGLNKEGLHVAVKGPTGKVWTLPPDKVVDALATGKYSFLSPEDRPILLVITNKSTKTLKSITFALRAFENGRSDDLAIDSDHVIRDVIVRPGGISKTCWKVPGLTRSVSVFFRAEKQLATFYDSDEFVPSDKGN